MRRRVRHMLSFFRALRELQSIVERINALEVVALHGNKVSIDIMPDGSKVYNMLDHNGNMLKRL